MCQKRRAQQTKASEQERNQQGDAGQSFAESSVAEQAELDRVRVALERRRGGQTLTRSEIHAIRRYEEKRQSRDWWVRSSRLPQHELMRLLEINAEQAKRWRAEGLPVHLEGHNVLYDLHDVIGWLKRRWQGRGETGSKQAAEIKLLIRREAALQLKMQIMSGELKSRADVERESCAKVVAMRAGLEALKRTLAPAVIELPDGASLEEAEQLIWDYIEPLLRAFAGDGHQLRHPGGSLDRGRKKSLATTGAAEAQ